MVEMVDTDVYTVRRVLRVRVASSRSLVSISNGGQDAEIARNNVLRQAHAGYL